MVRGHVGFDGWVYCLTLLTLWDIQLRISGSKSLTGHQDEMATILLTPFMHVIYLRYFIRIKFMYVGASLRQV